MPGAIDHRPPQARRLPARGEGAHRRQARRLRHPRRRRPLTGGYDPNATSADSALIRAEKASYARAGLEATFWPRNPGSWPGYLFTGAPLNLPAGHFGAGHGNGAHAPDEYYVIETASPNYLGLDGAVRSFVDLLFEVAG
jgi:acetylornithine deacetylase/succinyl-diaminopimelate desuccinylase-like protein